MDGALGLQRQLVEALARRLGARTIETHVSWVLLLPGAAYKFKKAVRLPFLDYGTLDARRRCCEEEVRLNRRLAPGLYLGVAPVGGSVAQPRLGGGGPVLEYAVHMRAFPQQALWSVRAGAGLLQAAETGQMACLLAAFHRGAARAPDTAQWGGAALVAARAGDDLAEIAALAGEGARTRLASLGSWQRAQEAVLAAVFSRRRARGQVREGHGDLHCANLLTLDGGVAAFDCIEFNDSMRWIDTMQDFAFAWMDLQYYRQPPLAALLLNRYLQEGGDYDGLRVLRYFGVQRALVRAKVALLHGEKGGGAAHGYLALAAALAAAPRPALVIMHGLSGSGKSSVAARLAEALGAVQIRADVERKRLAGIAPQTRAAAREGEGIYSRRAGLATQRALAAAARCAVEGGFVAILDATFLDARQRLRFGRRAQLMRVPFLLLDVRAPLALLEQRLAARSGDASDAGLAVLHQQIAGYAPLAQAERAHALVFDNVGELDASRVAALAAAVRAALWPELSPKAGSSAGRS